MALVNVKAEGYVLQNFQLICAASYQGAINLIKPFLGYKWQTKITFRLYLSNKDYKSWISKVLNLQNNQPNITWLISMRDKTKLKDC